MAGWHDLKKEPESQSITLHLSENIISKIDKKFENRSRYIIECIEDFLEDIEDIDITKIAKCNKKIITISTPPEDLNRRIYRIVKNYNIALSRSELVRFAILYRYLNEFNGWKRQQKENQENGVVRVPIGDNEVHVPINDENGQVEFKTYKILKRLEY